MKPKSTPTVPNGIVPYNALIGHILQKQREQLGRSQFEVAQSVGLTQSAYSRVESGQTALTVTLLRALANALGKTTDEILFEADSLEKALIKQGVGVPMDKPSDNVELKAALLIGLGVLLVLLANRK